MDFANIIKWYIKTTYWSLHFEQQFVIDYNGQNQALKTCKAQQKHKVQQADALQNDESENNLMFGLHKQERDRFYWTFRVE